MSALWDTQKLSTQSSSILIKHVTVSKKKVQKANGGRELKINQSMLAGTGGTVL